MSIKEIIQQLRVTMGDARGQESHFDSWLTQNEGICKAIDSLKILDTPPAQPAQQEPVAWMASKDGNNVLFTNIGKSADDLESYGWAVTPLYTTLFRLQPLTGGDILECWKQVYEPGRREYDNATRMARAIEAAHGIKE
jgi:hypothetical protein